jgi:hypothetical protein
VKLLHLQVNGAGNAAAVEQWRLQQSDRVRLRRRHARFGRKQPESRERRRRRSGVRPDGRDYRAIRACRRESGRGQTRLGIGPGSGFRGPPRTPADRGPTRTGA